VRECLDWLLSADRRHLEGVLRVDVDHDNVHRPHRALDHRPPGEDPGNVWLSVREAARSDDVTASAASSTSTAPP